MIKETNENHSPTIPKILFLGATGFLGARLVRRFVEKGYRIIAGKRSSSDTSVLSDLSQSIEWFTLGEASFDEILASMCQVDVVVYTAVAYGRSGETLEQVFEVNTALPFRLLTAAIRAGVNTFINTDTALHNHLNAYSLSKHNFSEWGRLFSIERPVRFINMRPEHIYGPGDDEKKFPTFVIRALLRNLAELKLTPGEQMRDFIFVDDVVDAYDTVFDAIPSLSLGFHEFSIGSGHSIRIREFVEIVQELTGSSTHAVFGALPYRQNEVMLSRADLKAIKKLGWEPRTILIEGLKRTIKEEKAKCEF